MGHHLTGIIGQSPTIETIARTHRLTPPAPLSAPWLFLALDAEDLDSMSPSPQDFTNPGFIHLSHQFMAFLKEHATKSPIAYIETDYFGSRGNQSAVAYRAGQLVQAPRTGSNAINAALKAMGFRCGIIADRFHRIGLHRYRSNEEAKEAGQPSVAGDPVKPAHSRP